MGTTVTKYGLNDNDVASFTNVSEWIDGTSMDDSKVDNFVYCKGLDDLYYKRNFDSNSTRVLVLNSSVELLNLDKSVLALLALGYYNKIETKGYYTPDDFGGGAFNVTSGSNANVDNGSVFDLSFLSLKAELISPSFLNYRQFGAKLNGDISVIDNETLSIQNCHNYANEKKIPVINNSGIIIINDIVIVKTSLDLTGSKILIVDGAAGKDLYQIESYNPIVSITDFNQSDLYMGAFRSDSFIPYKNYNIIIDSDETLCYRYDGGNISHEYKRDSISINDGGYFSDTSLIQDFTTGNLTITGQEIDKDQLTIRGLNIEWAITDANMKCHIMTVSRSNTVILDTKLYLSPNAPKNSSSYREGMIYIKDASQIRIENFKGENFVVGTVAGYVFNLDTLLNVTFNNTELRSGWGAIGGNNIKQWTVLNSVLNVVDCHINCANFYMSNCRMVGKLGILVGYGRGKIQLDNCVSDFTNEDGAIGSHVVRSHASYGFFFAGDVIINNHTIITNGTGNKYLLYCSVDNNVNADYRVAYNIEMPSLYASNIICKNSGNESLTLYNTQDTNFFYFFTTLTNGNKKLKVPSVVSASSVYLDIYNDDAYINIFKFIIPSNLTGVVTGNIYIKGNDILQPIHSYYSDNNPSSSDLTIPYKPIIWYTNPRYDNPSLYHNKIVLINCVGSLSALSNFDYIKIYNSEISYMATYQSTTIFPLKVIVRDSIVYPRRLGSGNLIFELRRYDMANCSLHMPTVDGSATGLSYVTTDTLYLKNNIFTGATDNITSTQLNYFNEYVDPSYGVLFPLPTQSVPANTTTYGLVKQTAAQSNLDSGAVLADVIAAFNNLLIAQRNSGQLGT